MKSLFLLIILSLSAIKTNAMRTNDHINADTLLLTGRIVKVPMENKKGEKMEDVQDYYFSTNSGSFFIKTAGSRFSIKELDALVLKEITVKCVKKFGNIDIDSNDPAYAATRVGEYILILEIMQQ